VRKGVKAVWIAALAGSAFLPGVACAQVSDPKPGQGAPAALPNPEPVQVAPQDETIVPDAEFEAALPKLSDDINAPLEPMQDFGNKPPVTRPATPGAVTSQIENFPPPAAEDPAFAETLVPLAQFKVEPVKIEGVDDEKVASIRYTTVVEGLDKIGLEDRFRDLSALEDGDGKAANATMVAARAREDEKLALRLMQSLGYYDGTATSTLDQAPKNSGNVRATITATPGNLYRLGEVKIVSDPTVPAGLLDKELNLNPGDPIQAERVQGAEPAAPATGLSLHQARRARHLARRGDPARRLYLAGGSRPALIVWRDRHRGAPPGVRSRSHRHSPPLQARPDL
jgi:translocation and assembly module TamA